MANEHGTAVLAEGKVIDLLLITPSLEEVDLRASLSSIGAPPWVRSLGTCFRWRSAVTGHLMFTVAPPLDPEVRLWDCDCLEVPTYQGKLSGLKLPDEDRSEVYRALFTTSAGCWADDEGNSVTLVL